MLDSSGIGMIGVALATVVRCVGVTRSGASLLDHEVGRLVGGCGSMTLGDGSVRSLGVCVAGCTSTSENSPPEVPAIFVEEDGVLKGDFALVVVKTSVRPVELATGFPFGVEPKMDLCRSTD